MWAYVAATIAGPTTEWLTGDRRAFHRLKAARLVTSVAERLFVGMAATAQGTSRFVRVNGERVPFGIENLDRAFDKKGPVVAHTNNHSTHLPSSNVVLPLWQGVWHSAVALVLLCAVSPLPPIATGERSIRIRL